MPLIPLEFPHLLKLRRYRSFDPRMTRILTGTLAKTQCIVYSGEFVHLASLIFGAIFYVWFRVGMSTSRECFMVWILRIS